MCLPELLSCLACTHPKYSVQDAPFWGAEAFLLETLGWVPRYSGASANCIKIGSVDKKAGPTVGRPMPRIDSIRKLCGAMLKADLAARHVNAAWVQVVGSEAEMRACPHPQSHKFPQLPLMVEDVLLCNFPTLELCVVCGLPLAAYPGVPHSMGDVGYSPLQRF